MPGSAEPEYHPEMVSEHVDADRDKGNKNVTKKKAI